MLGDPTELLAQYADVCIRCGICAQTDCGNYTEGVPNLGEICETLLAGDEEFMHFPFTCALCNHCTIDCPVDLHATEMTKPARTLLFKTHSELREKYRVFRTDLKYNLFSILTGRAAGEVEERHLISGAADLGGESDHTAFFPGCSLYTYGPELVEKVSDWLREESLAAFTLTFCCGATFFDSGFFDEFESYRADVQRFLAEKGIKHLVVTCPHCNHILPELLEGSGVDITLLPQLLLDHGMVSDREAKISMHDVCYDRDEGIFGELVRNLLAKGEMVPLAHEHKNCLCCGGGGMVSAYAPQYCEYRRNMRLAEMDEVETDLVASTCFSCVNSLQRGVSAVPVKHYLELIFGVDIDWAKVYADVDAMYADPKTSELLASDEKMFL